ncbi:MAG: hypothetical protein ABSD29_03420 [Verrucomicrobiota bacterium]|jgi:hypothetical protein
MAKLKFERDVKVTRLDRLVLAERLSYVNGESGRYMRAIIMHTRGGWVVRHKAMPAGYAPAALPAQAAASPFFTMPPQGALAGQAGVGGSGAEGLSGVSEFKALKEFIEEQEKRLLGAKGGGEAGEAGG